jgi:hypothetical protein
VPAIGRYQMPDFASTAGPIVRFVAQVFLLSTAALLVLQAARWGYVLANPTYPQEVVAAAAERWSSILWFRGFLEHRCFSPVVVCAVVGTASVGVVFALPDPTPESAAVTLRALGQARSPGGTETTLSPIRPLLGIAAMCLICLVYRIWAHRRVCGRAFAVWMLYGAGSDPVPGIYRPAGWLGSARVRQMIVAALVVLNVLVFRVAVPLDPLLSTGRGPGSPPDYDRLLGVCQVIFAVSLVLPVLFPFLWAPTLVCEQLKALHDLVEEVPPKDLYPNVAG